VELEDGQTYLIGGLIQHTVTANTSKVPIIGEIPFLGAAFSRKFFSDEEHELVILVTPHLVDAQSCDQVVKMLPGQETRTPDDFELFLEGILEAPRGPREVCTDGSYVPAFKNSPTASVYPCGGNGGNGKCGTQGCATCQGAGVDNGMPSASVSGAAPLPSGAPVTKDRPANLPPGLVGSNGSAGQR
jgi:pilus assembly protein CpaC